MIKTGVFTGAYAVNPANGARVPVWVSDYVLMGYGTGAIMAVPSIDERDRDFAEMYSIPVADVCAPGGVGPMCNSGFLDGMGVDEARSAAVAWLERQGCGTGKVEYKLRDWLFSRQRYWGEPFPVVHTADGRVVPLPEGALPLMPPELEDYRPTETGEPPLARAKDWMETVDPKTGLKAVRETNTMPQWAGSCWYYLRFVDPKNVEAPIDPEKEKYWLPVDLYVGGAEHAVLHLMYARFWHMVLHDAGVVSTPEPFRKLFNQGMILAHSYRDAGGKYHRPEEVEERGGRWFAGDVEVDRQVEKMSKSKYNVVDPTDVVDRYGADAMRLYELFMGPLDVAKPWQTSGVAGMSRFLQRVWRLVYAEGDEISPALDRSQPSPALARILHKTIRAVAEDVEGMRFNTAISKLMELANAIAAGESRPREVVEAFLLMLAPFAPHVCEELWSALGHARSLSHEPWPVFDRTLAADDVREYVVQVNGRLRGRVKAAADLSSEALLAAVRADSEIAGMLEELNVVKEVVVPGRLVNFVVRG